MKKILIFPCGSEIGLEIHKSLMYSQHFEIYGASSIDDHGKYIYKNYIGGLPFYNQDGFVESLNDVIAKYDIDAIYLTMDAVIESLYKYSSDIKCKIIGHSYDFASMCASKSITYKCLKDIVPVPEIYEDFNQNLNYPLFVKPDRGYGSRGTVKVMSYEQSLSLSPIFSDKIIITEYLPGDEWTIDCFTAASGELKYCSARKRKRVVNGISVNTFEDKQHDVIFKEYAEKVNKNCSPRGAWFFQMKENKDQKPVLLEVAARLAGASALSRMKGVNLSLLTVFDAFGIEVNIIENDYSVELDRSLENKFSIGVDYENIYVDLDDCLIISHKVNEKMISFIYKSINEGVKIHLLTRHSGDLLFTLNKFRLGCIFDEIIHLKHHEKKSDYIKNTRSIFIDDSYNERAEVLTSISVPVFSPDMIAELV